MLTTIIKSALLGLTLGAALAYAAEPDPIRGAGDYTPGARLPIRTLIADGSAQPYRGRPRRLQEC